MSLQFARWLLACWLAVFSGWAQAQPAPPATCPTTFTNPIVASGADPWVLRWQDHYYFCQAHFRSVWVNKADRLVAIGQGRRARVWTPPPGTAYSEELWAPELHRLGGKWFIYVAADDGNNAHHRMYALEGTSDNPQDPFVFRGKVAAPTDRWAIDGTVLQVGERLYFIWSGWDGTENVAQNLYIAPMSDPLTISGERVCISRPDYDWERHGQPWVNEGPEVLWHSNQLFVIYSASGSWGDDYCLGQLTWTGGDLLKAESWAKTAHPVFRRTETVFGPGHCSFVQSRDGLSNWIVYHVAKHRGSGWNRRVQLQPFSWKADGAPEFGTPVPAGMPLCAPPGE